MWAGLTKRRSHLQQNFRFSCGGRKKVFFRKNLNLQDVFLIFSKVRKYCGRPPPKKMLVVPKTFAVITVVILCPLSRNGGRARTGNLGLHNTMKITLAGSSCECKLQTASPTPVTRRTAIFGGCPKVAPSDMLGEQLHCIGLFYSVTPFVNDLNVHHKNKPAIKVQGRRTRLVKACEN